MWCESKGMSSFTERRGVSFAGILISVLIPVTVWWVCLSTDSLAFAWICAVFTALGVWTVLLMRAAQRIEVTPEVLRVGRAHLEAAWIGSAEAFNGAEWQALLRAGGGHTAWIDVRSYHPGGVKVENTDPNDPVAFWLVSSRNSIALAEALQHLVHVSGNPEDRSPSDG